MVLAQDLSGARRLTYGRVQRLAQQNRLAYQGSRYEPVEERGSTLTKLKVNVELTGTYNNMRSFIHAIETRAASSWSSRTSRWPKAATKVRCVWPRSVHLLPERQPMTRTRRAHSRAGVLLVGGDGRLLDLAVGLVRRPDSPGAAGAGGSRGATGRKQTDGHGHQARAPAARARRAERAGPQSIPLRAQGVCGAAPATAGDAPAQRPSRWCRPDRCRLRRHHRSHSGSSGSCSRATCRAALRY